jgi:hypothetical protein
VPLSAGCDDTNWTICTQLNTNASLAADYPGLFYHSSKFMNSAAIRYFKNVTDFLAGIGKKTALFEPFIYKMHCFTKTGSGQT